MKMSRFLPKKAHSTRNNDAFTHCGISFISPNTLHQKYSGSLKLSCFRLIFISSGKRHSLWSSFQENDPYIYIHIYGWGWGVEGGERLYTYRYTVATSMTYALRWAAMRAILMFHNCEGDYIPIATLSPPE